MKNNIIIQIKCILQWIQIYKLMIILHYIYRNKWIQIMNKKMMKKIINAVQYILMINYYSLI